MPTTLHDRLLLSNSNSPRSLSVNDVKDLLQTCKTEIIDSFKAEVSKLSNSINDLMERAEGIEDMMLMTNKKLNKHDDDIEFLKSEFSDLKVNIQRDVLSEIHLRDIKVNNCIWHERSVDCFST